MVTRAEAEASLKAAPWLQRLETQKLLLVLEGAEGRTRAVGGSVRDTLMAHARGNPDLDIATELTPGEVVARASAAGIAAYPTGIDHGTVTLKLGDETAEVTTLREDVETDGRHAVVRFGTDWVRDAERRDFTMNALYAGMDGTLFDPLGGLEDCLHARVRFIGDPDRRIAEDRLRVYRFFRFSASHGGERFDAAGLAACRLAAGTLASLSAERVGAEMLKLLAAPRVATTFRVMSEAGILELFEAAVGSLAAYETIAPTPQRSGRLALIVAASDADTLQTRWRLSNDTMGTARQTLAAAILLEHGGFHEAVYRYGKVVHDAVAVAAALNGWTEDAVSEAHLRLEGTLVPSFPVSGADLVGLGFKPGPRLGAELNRLERLWIESGFALDRQTLLDGMQH
ncbi:MAG TPA: CCA tRNA nucleotidyltransferase [Devosiaceae bacterium]|jgi:poly(A) polymerase